MPLGLKLPWGKKKPVSVKITGPSPATRAAGAPRPEEAKPSEGGGVKAEQVQLQIQAPQAAAPAAPAAPTTPAAPAAPSAASAEITDEAEFNLFEGSACDEVELIKGALASGADPTRCAVFDGVLTTPLAAAAAEGAAEAVDYLLSLEAVKKAGAGRPDGVSTPLMVAAREGHVSIVTKLLEAGHAVDDVLSAEKPLTALWVATYNGNEDAVQALLGASANVNHPAVMESTPLLAAAETCHASILKRLLGNGADIKARLTTAPRPNAVSLIFANKEAHPEQKAEAEAEAKAEAERLKKAECLKLLLDAGVGVDEADDHGGTPLMLASAAPGYDECVKLLLERGANVNAVTTNSPQTAAIFMTMNNKEGLAAPAILSRLLEAKADPNLTMENGATPLIGACELPDEEAAVKCATLLLSAGAGASIKQAATPAAGSVGRMTALHYAATKLHAALIPMLIKASADVNATNSKGATPLYSAVAVGCKVSNEGAVDAKVCQIVRLLIEAKAQVDVTPGDTSNAGTCSALSLAASAGDTSSVEALLKAGADPTWAAADGETALIGAARKGSAECITLLWRSDKMKGEHFTAAMADGTTALHCAAGNGHAECVTLLLKTGAMATQPMAGGDTALASAVLLGAKLPIAQQSRFGECAAILLDAGDTAQWLQRSLARMLNEKDVAAREQATAAISLLMSYYPAALAARDWTVVLGPKQWTKCWIDPTLPMLRDVRTSRDATTALHVMFATLLTNPAGEAKEIPSAVTASVKAGVVTELVNLLKAKGEYTESIQSKLHLESRGLAAAALIAIAKTGAAGSAAVVKSGAVPLIVTFLRSGEAAALFKEDEPSVLPKGTVSATVREAVASLASLAKGDAKLDAAVKAAGGLPELGAGK